MEKLEADTRHRLEPFRATMAANRARFANLAPDRELERKALQRLVSGRWSVEHALCVFYLVWGDADAKRFWTHVTLFETSLSEKVKAHNYWVLEAAEEYLRRLWGPYIERLEFPLWPATVQSKEVEEYHEGLLEYARQAPEVSGAGPRRVPKTVASAFAAHGGQPYLPVETFADGTMAVDAQQVADAFNGRDQRADATERRLAKLERELTAARPGKPPKCRNFLNGRCTYGAMCRYAHAGTPRGGEAEGGPQVSLAHNQHGGFKSAARRAPAAFAAPHEKILKRGLFITGGDFYDCLSAVDIDALLGPVIPPTRLLSAMTLYSVRVGLSGPGPVIDFLRRATARASVIAPVHVRHHWALAVFTACREGVRALVLDSAPSPVTAADIERLLRSMLACVSVRIVASGNQPRDTNECGVHAIVNAWRAFYGFDGVIATGQLSLEHLRRPFAVMAESPKLTAACAHRIALDPTARVEWGHDAAGTAPLRAGALNTAGVARNRKRVAASAQLKSSVAGTAQPKHAAGTAQQESSVAGTTQPTKAAGTAQPKSSAAVTAQPKHAAGTAQPKSSAAGTAQPKYAAGTAQQESSAAGTARPKYAAGTAQQESSAAGTARPMNAAGTVQQESSVAGTVRPMNAAGTAQPKSSAAGTAQLKHAAGTASHHDTAVNTRRHRLPPPYEHEHAFVRPCALSVDAAPFRPMAARIPDGGTAAREEIAPNSSCPPADEPATTTNVNRRNLCYMLAATQALDLALWGRTVARSTNSLWRLQARLGHEHGIQQDVVETVPQLIEKCQSWQGARVFWCREDGGLSRTIDGRTGVSPDAKTAFIALDNQADAFACPPSHEVVAWVEFTGTQHRSASGIVSAERGHYILYEGSPPARTSGRLRTLYVLRPTQPPRDPPPPCSQGGQQSRAQAATARALGISTDAATRIVEQGTRIHQTRRDARRVLQEEVSRPPEDTTAQDAQPLTRQQLRAKLDQFRDNDTIRVHWGRQVGKDGDHEAGVWFGRVRAMTPSMLVEFTHGQCPDCLAPRSLGSEVLIQMPLQRTLYYDVSKTPLPSVAACVCLQTDPSDERPYEHGTGMPNSEKVLAAIEGQCLGAPGAFNPRATRTGAAGQQWHIFAGKPPHVHELVWRKLAATTRAQHLRWLHCIRGMHADLLGRPLPSAIVEYVLRMATARRWCWATVSSALSACASAVAQLPLYTSEQHAIDLRSDPYFAQALQNAQRMARTTAGKTSLSTGMTVEQLEHLTSSRGIKAPSPRLLLLLGWHFGARIGDMRQVRPCDIVMRHREARADGAVPTVVTFRFGKGAAFWGPYSIHAILPKRVASDLIAAMNGGPADAPLFTLHDQAALSHAVGALAEGTGRLNLRSVRRGAIQNAAERGLSDEDVMRLSGHKRLDTLYRYLGWGVGSHCAKNAAIKRYHAAMPRGGATDTPMPTATPAKMGRHSGFTGAKGRRVEAPPQFFPKKPPTREQCGLAPTTQDVSEYRLHIKPTTRVNWQALQRMAKNTPLRNAVAKAQSWCTSDRWYGPTRSVEPCQIPYAAFTGDQIRELIRADKIRPHHGPVKGFVKAFTVAQHAKKRLRVIAEPVINQTFEREQLYRLAYPARLERRARARGAKYSVEFDFAAFFDQFQLAGCAMPWFVLRSREAVEGHRLFALTRMPMGASFAPSVAQAVTSALVYPLTQLDGVRVDTMIDNVRIVAESKSTFVQAVRGFLERVKAANITLNDAADWENLTDDDLALRCAVTDAPRVFLGEKYIGDTVCNADTAVEKLIAARDRYVKRVDPENPEAPQYSLRNFASFVGLMLFMAHTINVPLTGLHTMLRAYGEIISHTNDWDATCVITSEAVDRQVLTLADWLIRNEPVSLPVLRPPETELDAYDAAIEVDASLSAWGAVVRFRHTGKTVTLQQRWSTPVAHSAHAEPKAARRALQWVRAQPGCANARIAVITDHVAMATGQRRWYANYGGFSTSYYLNSFFQELYDMGGGEIFHIDGVRNRADQLSRDPSAPLHMAVREVDVSFTDLRSVRHPHEKIPRLPYQL